MSYLEKERMKEVRKIELNKSFIKKLAVSLCFFILAIIIPYFSSKYIEKNFANAPVLRDLVLEQLPYVSIIWLSELFIAFSVIYMFIWAFKKNINYIPYAIFIYSIFQIIRAGLIVLTPIGLPGHYNGLAPVGEKSVFMYGAFPSGHLSYPVNTYLLTQSWVPLVFSFIVAIVLLVSRAHYSIDLIGTILLTFFVYILSEKYIKKYFMKQDVKNKESKKQ